MDEVLDNVVEKSLPDLPDSDSIESGSGFIVGDYLTSMVTGMNCELPPYWSRGRDAALRKLSEDNQYLGGVLFSIQSLLYNLILGTSVVPDNTTIKLHNDMADRYNKLLYTALHNNLEQFITDILVMDNGGFMYIDGETPSRYPLTSLPTGLTVLDSMLCTRTRNKEFPVIYHHPSGKNLPIHNSRIIFFAQAPSTDWKKNKIGISSVSKLHSLAVHLEDISIYEREQMGSLESDKIIHATGISHRELDQAISESEIMSANVGRRRRGKAIYLASKDPSGKLSLINLKENTADKRNDVETTVTLMALMLGVSQFLLLESTQSSSTRSAAKESVKASNSKLILWFYNKLTTELSTKFLPEYLNISETGLGKEIDSTKSRTYLNNALRRKNDLTVGVTTDRVERELMLSNGEITHTQFEQLELADERLPNGLHISTIFLDKNTNWERFLPVTNPLSFNTNNSEEMILLINEGLSQAITAVNKSISINLSKQLTQIIYALQWLENQYQSPDDDLDVVEINNEPLLQIEEGGADRDRDFELNVPERDLENENALEEKQHTSDWLGDALAGRLDIDFEYEWTKASRRRFRQEVRAATRGVWDSSLTQTEASNVLRSTLRDQLEGAYTDRLKKLGVELTNAELRDSMKDMFERVDKYLPDFINYVSEHSKGSGKLATVYNRADLWVNTFEEMEEAANANTKIDGSEEFIWRVGNTDHCSTCLDRDGRVFTRTQVTEFDRNGTMPKGRQLECSGYNCRCTLEKI